MKKEMSTEANATITSIQIFVTRLNYYNVGQNPTAGLCMLSKVI